MKRPEKKMTLDMISDLAALLTEKWAEYERLFGHPPHGHTTQLAAMLELRGGEKSIRRVFKRHQHGKKRG